MPIKSTRKILVAKPFLTMSLTAGDIRRFVLALNEQHVPDQTQITHASMTSIGVEY